MGKGWKQKPHIEQFSVLKYKLSRARAKVLRENEISWIQQIITKKMAFGNILKA